MSQFDVHALTAGDGLVVDVQSDLIVSTRTRAVIPLLDPSSAPERAATLHPTVLVGDVPFVLATHLIGAVPEPILKSPVASLQSQRDKVVRAMDWLFQGF